MGTLSGGTPDHKSMGVNEHIDLLWPALALNFPFFDRCGSMVGEFVLLEQLLRRIHFNIFCTLTLRVLEIVVFPLLIHH